MPYPHTIRLHGPWQYETLDGSSSPSHAALSGTMRLPSDWGKTHGAEFRGRVRYRRRFGRPANLDAHERVWLVCDGVDAWGTVCCNGTPLGAVRGYALPAAFDVTGLLEARNEVSLDVEFEDTTPDGSTTLRPGHETQPGGPIGEVRLEVRASQFLDKLSVWLEAEAGESTVRLVVRAAVAGEQADGPFEVLVLAGRREVMYREVAFCAALELAESVTEVPAWVLGPGPCRLEQVEVRLLRAGTRLWQWRCGVAARRLDWDAARRRLAVGDAELDLSGRLPSQLRVARSIDPPWLSDCDRDGIGVIQCVPAEWVEEVCPRLAHHPAIVAWCATQSELAGLSDAVRELNCMDRPWIEWEQLPEGS